MKRKITYALVTWALIVSAFFIGKTVPSKYEYLPLNRIESVTETSGIVTIDANGNTYTFETEDYANE